MHRPRLNAEELGVMLKNGRTPGEGDSTYYESIRARRAASDEEEVSASESDQSPSEDDDAFSDSEADSDDSEDKGDEDDDAEGDGEPPSHSEDELSAAEESDPEDSDQDLNTKASTISFGALAKAQETLAKRKRPPPSPTAATTTTTTKRARTDPPNTEALERQAGKKAPHRHLSRPSNHAPAELSSKKAVSRKRQVVPTKTVPVRDPRFEPLSGPLNPEKLKHNYAFLDTYRQTEMTDLKTAIRATKDPGAKETLKRALLGMESKLKAQEAKEREQAVVREHRREEKGKVEKGKKPFFLKKGERKRLELMKRFEGMGGREVERVMERRRKKVDGRGRRGMPGERRGTGGEGV